MLYCIYCSWCATSKLQLGFALIQSLAQCVSISLSLVTVSDKASDGDQEKRYRNMAQGNFTLSSHSTLKWVTNLFVFQMIIFQSKLLDYVITNVKIKRFHKVTNTCTAPVFQKIHIFIKLITFITRTKENETKPKLEYVWGISPSHSRFFLNLNNTFKNRLPKKNVSLDLFCILLTH